MPAEAGIQLLANNNNFKNLEPLAKVTYSVILANPGSGSGAGAGIQNCLKKLDSGSRFACPE
jgi:hypothetical protein